MAPEAVLFDLFGTLIGPYRFREHQQWLAEAAIVLNTDQRRCTELWTATWARRARGEFRSIEENLGVLGPGAAADELAKAARMYEAFTIESLAPKPDAIDVLRGLRERGMRTALVTNCAPDVPVLWPSTVFADLFDLTIFSCQVGYMKPEKEIFELALDAVGVPAARAWFIGDGSDDELSAALSIGMTAVLVENDLTNTYDSHRHDVVGWTGPAVRRLRELLHLVDQCT